VPISGVQDETGAWGSNLHDRLSSPETAELDPVDFSKQLAKAEEALNRRNYDFAADLYRQLVDIEPDLGEARAGLRRANQKRAERKKRGFFGKASGALPLSKARGMAKLKKYDAAARALEDYLVGAPLDEEGLLFLGEMLAAAGHNKSAFAVFGFLAEIAPRHVEGLKQAGALAQATGDVFAAIEYYERALAADPRDQEAIKARKNLSAEAALSQSSLQKVGHSRDAMRDQAEAARLERRTRRHQTPEELEAEVRRLEDALAEGTPTPDALIEIGELYAKLRDWPAALEFHERAFEYRSDDFDLECTVGDLRGRVLKKQIATADKRGERERADELEKKLLDHELHELERRVDRRPGDMQLRLALGKRLEKGDDIDGALAAFQKVLGDPRMGSEAHFHLAGCFQKKGILDLARKEYQTALAGCRGVDDRAKEILYNLGLISEAEGDPSGARSSYIRIFEVDIGYRDVAAKMESL
jgi:tetratricopeptide (TPR) repeat protein